MKVNIVMLVKDRPRLTNQAFRTLHSNTDPNSYNLTIVDDESEGDYLPARDFALLGRPEQTTMLTITNSKHITGQARNLGVYFAEKYWGRGDYLYLSDNDVYFTPGWLEKLLAAFGPAERDRKVKLLGGWNHQYLQPHPCEPAGAWYGAPTFDYGVLKYCTHDAVTGASQLMRWETWDKYGPLDAHTPGVCKSEDYQFCQDIIKDGGRVGSIYPRVVFNCGLTNSYGESSVGADLVLKELQEAKRKYPELYWE